MADEGKFEPGYEGDALPSVPMLGAGTIDTGGDALRLEIKDEALRLVGDGAAPSWKKTRTRKRARELLYAWQDVLAVSSDARDPRVIVLVVQHEGRPHMLRFRPEQSTPPLLSDLQWMAANAFADDEDDDPSLDAMRAELAKLGISVDVARCTGPGCKMCEQLRELHRSHSPPS